MIWGLPTPAIASYCKSVRLALNLCTFPVKILVVGYLCRPLLDPHSLSQRLGIWKLEPEFGASCFISNSINKYLYFRYISVKWYRHLVGGNDKITIHPIVIDIPAYTTILPPLRNNTMVHNQLINHPLTLNRIGQILILVYLGIKTNSCLFQSFRRLICDFDRGLEEFYWELVCGHGREPEAEIGIYFFWVLVFEEFTQSFQPTDGQMTVFQ